MLKISGWNFLKKRRRALAESDRRWKTAGSSSGWNLPETKPWYFRLPIIRVFRAVVEMYRVDRHNRFYRQLGQIPTGYDEWIIYAIQRGWY